MKWLLAAAAVTIAAIFLMARNGAPPMAARECERALRYRIGAIDARYHLRPEALMESARAAAALWNEAAGREVLVYDVTGPLTLSLLFDERQEKVEGHQQMKALIAQWEQLKTQHSALLPGYQAAVEAAKGRSVTREEFDRVESMRQQLNSIVSLQNLLYEQMKTLNQEISGSGSGADHAASDRIFIQGEYQADTITIYAFSSKEQIERVLAHEFGHALKLDHVEDPAAIMHFKDSGKDGEPAALADDDRQALLARCGRH